MTLGLFQDDLVCALEEIFHGFELEDPQGNMGKINIFKQELPVPKRIELEKVSVEQLESGLAEEMVTEEPFPYIIVRMAEGEIPDPVSTHKVNTLLLIGICDRGNDRQGHRTVMEIIQKIYGRFAKDPILKGRYQKGSWYNMAFPVAWTLQDEPSPPYYFGGMELSWDIPAVRREDRFA